ncbi:ABC transporter ATP-binding protein [Pseudobacteriovorax antillogorgiicola]|uniref:ABC-type multidrug transport system, ATPase and permease component n=1 Tax=Pseudobacteriovorax antillogorgiicola TaxID=1513793 RepID=A0A1Y6B2S6_9BACT|nr:ABC transporter ATP-binding protein [Pseudobacteriovorax antillogorgiicola]TCS59415.1 ABC-type multidrug transport system fused ATPase/permease subunit [Pseudobacteriovorax antillogorgiicola]SME88501.1 ABC-type multidrug transport system, ATPase and permease component [Pseudobacteriovorax antillogorgiicola]
MIKLYLKQHWGSILIATLCSLLLGLVSTVLFSLVGPALQIIIEPQLTQVSWQELLGPYLGNLLTELSGTDHVKAAKLWQLLPYLLIGLAGLRALFASSQWFLWERTSEKIAASMRSHLVKAYINLKPQASYENESFDQKLSSILTTDVKMTREYLIHFYGGLPRELIQVLLYLVTLVLLSPKLFLIFILGIGPAGVLISRLGKKIRRRSAKALDNFGQLSEWLQQRLMGVETIKQYQTEEREVASLVDLTEELNRRFLKTIRVKARTAPIIETIAVGAMVGVLFIALDMVSEGTATGSVLMSFFSILAILSQSASKLGRYYNSNREGGAAVERIQELQGFMDQNHQADMKVENHQGVETVVLDQISLRYPGQETPALDEVSSKFYQGKIYCLCGPSGAGKSSLFSALLGLVEPDSGTITYREGIQRSDIGYLPQAMFVAPTSLGENISYPEKNPSPAALHKALVDAAADELASKLDGDSSKEDSLEAEQLSGGQIQRAFMARVFYHHFPVVLIDEGTSAVDPENEARIYQSMRRLADDGACVIMIAHRHSGIQLADEVLYLEKGKLVAQGGYQELKQLEQCSELFQRDSF